MSLSQMQPQSKHPLTQTQLAQFTGTEGWYRSPLSSTIAHTDGIQHVIDAGGAGWLISDIVIFQAEAAIAALDGQFWKLTVLPDRSAVLTCDDGNGNVIFRNEYAYSDFPLNEITIYLFNDVILLPSEY